MSTNLKKDSPTQRLPELMESLGMVLNTYKVVKYVYEHHQPITFPVFQTGPTYLKNIQHFSSLKEVPTFFTLMCFEQLVKTFIASLLPASRTPLSLHTEQTGLRISHYPRLHTLAPGEEKPIGNNADHLQQQAHQEAQGPWAQQLFVTRYLMS